MIYTLYHIFFGAQIKKNEIAGQVAGVQESRGVCRVLVGNLS